MVHWWVLVHCGLMPAATGITRFRPNLVLPHMGHYSSTVHSLCCHCAHTISDTLACVQNAMGLVHPGGRDSVAAMGSTRACSEE